MRRPRHASAPCGRGGREGGIALILALLVLVILIAVVAQMTIGSRQSRTVAENHLADLQNTYGVRAGYAQASLFLQADKEQFPDVDSLREKWAQPIEFDLQKAHVTTSIFDCERFINLSQLVNDKGERNPIVVAQLRRLVRALRQPPDIADRITDYIDADSQGEFETRAKNERLYNLEELLRIDGITPEVLYGSTDGSGEKKGLLPFVTIWPQTIGGGGGSVAGAVNINTAPAEVLLALSDRISLALAEAIVAWRAQPGSDGRPQEFRKIEDLKQVPGLSDEVFGSLQGQVVVKSATFEIRVRSRVGSVEKAWVYVVKRAAGPQGGVTLIRSQRMNDFLSVKPPEEEKP